MKSKIQRVMSCFHHAGRSGISGIVLLLMISINARSLGETGITRHDRERQQYRDIGKRSEFNCVGRYSISTESTDYAAGVLVSPNWVLTAAHFVQDSSVWLFGSQYYKTKRIVKHPMLEPGASETQWEGHDLALVELEKSVLNVKPAVRYSGYSEVGTRITKIGFGYVGNGREGMATPRMQERLGGNNIVEAAGGTFEGRDFSSDVLVCDFDDPNDSSANKFGSTKPLELEIGGSKGDSGGGVFIEEDGQQMLAGIVSGALNREIKYGSVIALARVSSANIWIDTVLSN